VSPFSQFLYNNNHSVFQLDFKSTLEMIEMAMKSYFPCNKDFKIKVTGVFS